MRTDLDPMLRQVELLTRRMGFSILYLVTSSFLILNPEGRGSPTKKKTDEEIEGKAATKETEQDTMDCSQPLQNANNQDLNPLSDPTNNQPTEETGEQLPEASKDKHLNEVDRNHMPEKGIASEPPSAHGLPPQTSPETQTRSSKLPNDLQPVNSAQIPRQAIASSPQTETDGETKELTDIMADTQQPARVEKETMLLELQMDRDFHFSWGVIGLSAAMLGVYLGLLGNNRHISDHMVLYEASLWLLYTSLFLGLIMLMIASIRPCTQLSRSFIYGFMSLALLSGTYAISLGIYILLPKSTFRLVIVSVLPVALFLMAMILYFKDSITTTAQKFGFKQHQHEN